MHLVEEKNSIYMKKSIIILSSTSRRGGNTDLLCDRFMEGAKDAGHDVEKILLRDKNINECLGCGLCYNFHKECPQKDDAALIIDKMVNSDVIVMASPVYFYNICGRLKTMIDRCCAHFLEMTNKEFYLIAAMGEDNRELMERAFDSMRSFIMCCPNSKEKGVVAATGSLNIGDVKSSPAMEAAYQLGYTVGSS